MELKTLNRIEEMMEKHSLTLGKIRRNALKQTVTDREKHSEEDQAIKKNITNNK